MKKKSPIITLYKVEYSNRESLNTKRRSKKECEKKFSETRRKRTIRKLLQGKTITRTEEPPHTNGKQDTVFATSADNVSVT